MKMRRWPALVVLTAVAGCSLASGGPYPLPTGPPHAWATIPRSLGVSVPQVVLWLAPRPGDRIELIEAEPIGVDDGASVRLFLSRPIHEPNGDWLIGEQLEALSGAVVVNETSGTAPETQVGIVAEITAHEPGRYELTGIRLRYRLNRGSEQVGEGIDVIFIVCADDPAPQNCESSAPPR
jgi:hypothetical protein